MQFIRFIRHEWLFVCLLACGWNLYTHRNHRRTCFKFRIERLTLTHDTWFFFFSFALPTLPEWMENDGNADDHHHYQKYVCVWVFFGLVRKITVSERYLFQKTAENVASLVWEVGFIPGPNVCHFSGTVARYYSEGKRFSRPIRRSVRSCCLHRPQVLVYSSFLLRSSMRLRSILPWHLYTWPPLSGGKMSLLSF